MVIENIALLAKNKTGIWLFSAIWIQSDCVKWAQNLATCYVSNQMSYGALSNSKA